MTEEMQIWIASKLPKWLVKWATIRLMVHATGGDYSKDTVSELTVSDALIRWDADA